MDFWIFENLGIKFQCRKLFFVEVSRLKTFIQVDLLLGTYELMSEIF